MRYSINPIDAINKMYKKKFNKAKMKSQIPVCLFVL